MDLRDLGDQISSIYEQMGLKNKGKDWGYNDSCLSELARERCHNQRWEIREEIWNADSKFFFTRVELELPIDIIWWLHKSYFEIQNVGPEQF